MTVYRVFDVTPEGEEFERSESVELRGEDLISELQEMKLNLRKINVRFNFKNFTPVQRALTTCAVALDEFRMFYKRPYKRKNGR